MSERRIVLSSVLAVACSVLAFEIATSAPRMARPNTAIVEVLILPIDAYGNCYHVDSQIDYGSRITIVDLSDWRVLARGYGTIGTDVTNVRSFDVLVEYAHGRRPCPNYRQSHTWLYLDDMILYSASYFVYDVFGQSISRDGYTLAY